MTGNTTTGISARQVRNIRLTVVSLLLLVVVIVGGFVMQLTKPRVMSSADLKLNGAFMFDVPRALPEFELLSHRGERFVASDFEGQWSLVFFGFTYCPDICPTTMAFLARFMEELESFPEAADTRVVMVSVDPARDSPERLAEYVPYFNPDFLGVTGEFLEIHRLATGLNTPFRKVPGEDDSYLVEHSANVVLINPRGPYYGFFKAPLELDKLILTYRSIRAAWDQ